MLYLIGIIITFFLAIILFTKKGKTTADNVLAAWLCVIGIHLLLYYLFINDEIYNHPYLLGVGVPMPLFHGPLLYIYTLTVTRYNHLPKRYWLHLLPIVVAYVSILKFFVLSTAEKISVYKHEGAGFETHTRFILAASIISGFAYVTFSYRELYRYKKRISDEFSNTEKINLNWLRYLIYGILVIWLVIALNGEDALIFATAVLFVLLLGYFGINHTGIFTYRQSVVKEVPIIASTNQQVDSVKASVIAETGESTAYARGITEVEKNASQTDEQVTEQTARYEKSSLQKEVADKIYEELILLMQKEKFFKNAELSLGQLAHTMQVHPNNLSQVINTYENKNFYDYINNLRIDEFKSLALLPENNRYTLLSLAFECGFNSKTSFNRNFRKITGKSPSEFLEEANIKLT
jgi:AraC-like DNA-binding protein